ncbi:LytTR family DNA-binding domain-containing protein, partial [Flavonifractor plautii]
GNGFARPHNSFLVNLDFVDRIQKANLLLTDGTEIPISRNRKKLFDEALFHFLRR